MKKKYRKISGYEGLLFETVKEKYFDLIIGVFVFTIISSLLYKNLVFKLPHFSFFNKALKQKVVKKTPVKTYIVTEGDDLWHVAEKFYGSGFNAYDISVANKLGPLSVIEPGQKLIIPAISPRTATVGDILNGISTKVTYTEEKYIVQPGDSLSLIAQKVYGDLYAWPKLLQANSLTSPDQIEVGMILIIPR